MIHPHDSLNEEVKTKSFEMCVKLDISEMYVEPPRTSELRRGISQHIIPPLTHYHSGTRYRCNMHVPHTDVAYITVYTVIPRWGELTASFGVGK